MGFIKMLKKVDLLKIDELLFFKTLAAFLSLGWCLGRDFNRLTFTTTH